MHKRKNGFTLRLTPEFQEFWTARPRDSFWFQNRCVFHIVHWFLHLPPDVWYKHMLEVIQHTTASALNNQEATATFLLFPNWMENSTNAFHKT
jgi:hypothetical protein